MQGIYRNGAGKVRNGWKALGFYAVCAFTLLAVSGLALALAFGVGFNLRLIPEAWLNFAAILLATWFCVRVEGKTLASVGFALDMRALRHFGKGLAVGAALVAATFLLVMLAGAAHLEVAGTVDPVAIGALAVTMLGAVLFEEALFRGYAFRRAADGMGEALALAVFALIFMLLHPLDSTMSPGAMTVATANLLLAAVLLGAWYLRTGRIALPAGLHLGWNLSMQMLGFSISGGPEGDSVWRPVFDSGNEWLTGGDYGLQASVLSLPPLVLAIWWVLRRGRQVESPA